MPQIYISASLISLLALASIGTFVFFKTPKGDRSLIVLLIAIELPMSFASYYLVRLPLVDGFVRLIVDPQSSAYGFITTFYAPLSEEPFKLLPLLIPWVYKKIGKANYLQAAMALGLGLGVGEIWLVASFIAKAPQFANISWYQFGGFMNERFMVCIMHGAFTATALRMIHKKLWLGVLGGMGLHYLGNFPIYLSSIRFLGYDAIVWQMIVGIYVPVYFVAMILLLAYYVYGTLDPGEFSKRKSVCPACKAEYLPPTLALNWVGKRFEKCPNCKKWHWVDMIITPKQTQ